MTDQLLLNNGHKPELLSKLKKPGAKRSKRTNRQKQQTSVTLKILHLSDKCTAEIKRAAKSCFLPIRVVSTPGCKLGQILTSSKQQKPTTLSTAQNFRTQLQILQVVDEREMHYIQHRVQSDVCSYRLLNGHTMQHYIRFGNRSASMQTLQGCKQTYKNKTIAKHYHSAHPGTTPDLKLDIVDLRGSSIRNKSIIEAKLILCEGGGGGQNNKTQDGQKFRNLLDFVVFLLFCVLLFQSTNLMQRTKCNKTQHKTGRNSQNCDVFCCVPPPPPLN